MNARLMISLTVYLLATSTLFAQEERKGGPEMSAELRQIIDDCHTSLNIPRPERGQRKERGSEPSAEEQAKMKEMDSNFQKISACVESKGYSMPDHPRRGGGHHRPPQDDENSSSDSTSRRHQAQLSKPAPSLHMILLL